MTYPTNFPIFSFLMISHVHYIGVTFCEKSFITLPNLLVVIVVCQKQGVCVCAYCICTILSKEKCTILHTFLAL